MIRDDDELLAEFCRRFPKRWAADPGFRRDVARTDDFKRWAARQRSIDILAEAERKMRY